MGCFSYHLGLVSVYNIVLFLIYTKKCFITAGLSVVFDVRILIAVSLLTGEAGWMCGN